MVYLFYCGIELCHAYARLKKKRRKFLAPLSSFCPPPPPFPHIPVASIHLCVSHTSAITRYYCIDTAQGELTTPLVGCDDAMTELRAFLLAPLANPSLLQGLGLRAATGALLHGPPGCGKTSVARALAAESRGVANFLEVRCSDLVDKVRSEGEEGGSGRGTGGGGLHGGMALIKHLAGMIL